MKKIIVFGNGSYAKTISYYIDNYTDWLIEGYSTDLDISCKSFNQKKYITFDKLLKFYSPDEYEIVMGIGYSNMNNLRKNKFNMLKEYGYFFPNFVHPTALINNTVLGQGNVILENVVIEPYTELGDDNIVWSNVLLGHNGKHGSHNHYAVSCSLAGNCIVKNNCFFGNHSTVKDGIQIADYSLLGAGVYVSKNTSDYDVIVPSKSIKLDKKSTFFI